MGYKLEDAQKLIDKAKKNGLRVRESKKPPKKKLVKKTFRSNFEESVWESIPKHLRKSVGYESEKINYTQPAVQRTYTPDFIPPNGIYIEAKGRLTLADRKKTIMIRDSNPGIDIRFVFQDPTKYIRKGSKTTYSMWAEKNGFLWASGQIPLSWLMEKKP